MKDKIGGSLQSVTVLQHASPVLDMRYTTKKRNFCTNKHNKKQCCGSRVKKFLIRIKELKKLFLSSRKYDPGCSSRIPDPDFMAIPDRGVKKAPDPGPQH
jgi:hypothetical protein